MLRAGNSGDGMADLSGVAVAPVRQREAREVWRGGPGVDRRLEEGSWIQADQPEATEEPDGTIRVKLAPNVNPPQTSNVTLEQNEA